MSSKQRTLGSGSAALVSPVQGLGCMGLSAFYATSTEFTDDQKIQFLRDAIALGITHLDTSDIYGPYTNEILIGKAISGIPRSNLIIATKFGIAFTETGVTIRGDREYVRQAVEGSLARLGTSYIDLYYAHRISQTTPIEETMVELAKLVSEGKIKYIGLSESHPNTVRRAHAVHPITCVQIEWSLWSREVEEDLIPVLRELGIGIVAYSPLGRGFLAGLFKKPEDLKVGDYRNGCPRFYEENFKGNLTLLEQLEKIAAKRGRTPAQIALAWVQNQGEDVVTIPGTTKIKNLQENLKALDISLTPEELKEIASAVPVGEVKGLRYKDGSTYRLDNNPLPNK